MIEIKNLHAAIDGKAILKGLSLQIGKGEIHAIMGPNGAGKSTLARVLAGDPSYAVTEGEVWFQGADLLAMEPEERARAGLFMSFQYPLEISGVSNLQFLHASYSACAERRGKPPLSEEAFSALLDEKMATMEMRSEFKTRHLNEGFSGGEKKRNEILQMVLLKPSLAILDETDSGLDIDAMRVVARGVNAHASEERSLLLITHYQRLLDHVRPHHVHVMVEGQIVHSGGAALALELEKKGYEWIA